MTDTLKHTPTPWRYDPMYKNSALVVADQDHEAFPYQDACIECHSANGGPEQNKSNAEFIVRAVNNHQALLDACRNMVKLYEMPHGTEGQSFPGEYHRQAKSAIQEAEK